MQRPEIIIFDVNETLLDLAPLRTSVGKALGDREDLMRLWFSTMLHYSLAETITGNYHSFGEIGIKPEEAMMVAAHAWDLMGAKNVGLQTAFIVRPGAPLYPNVAKPDYVVNDLKKLRKHLQKLGEGK